MLKPESNQAVENFFSSVDTEFNQFLHDRKPEDYQAAAQLILESQAQGGRIHVTGIGKCSHVATYVASLLSSTGNPAYYLHGTEAVHGSCGQLVAGDVVIATGAIRFEHTSREYAPIEYPAVADFEVATALVEAAKAGGYRFHTGVVQCKDSFYGQHSPARMPVSYELLNKWEAWKRLGVKASEMESAALFVVADALGCRCGSCFHVIWNQEREAAGLDQKMTEDTSSAVRLGVEALKKLIQADRAR